MLMYDEFKPANLLGQNPILSMYIYSKYNSKLIYQQEIPYFFYHK